MNCVSKGKEQFYNTNFTKKVINHACFLEMNSNLVPIKGHKRKENFGKIDATGAIEATIKTRQ